MNCVKTKIYNVALYKRLNTENSLIKKFHIYYLCNKVLSVIYNAFMKSKIECDTSWKKGGGGDYKFISNWENKQKYKKISSVQYEENI